MGSAPLWAANALLVGVVLLVIVGLMCLAAAELWRSTARDSFELNINDRLTAVEESVASYGRHALTERIYIAPTKPQPFVPVERYTPPNWNMPVPIPYHHFDSRN